MWFAIFCLTLCYVLAIAVRYRPQSAADMRFVSDCVWLVRRIVVTALVTSMKLSYVEPG